MLKLVAGQVGRSLDNAVSGSCHKMYELPGTQASKYSHSELILHAGKREPGVPKGLKCWPERAKPADGAPDL